MPKCCIVALVILIIISQLCVVAIDGASGASNSTPYFDQQEFSAQSSFEDALIYPKHAISPHHVGEEASSAFVEPVSRKIPKFKLKIDKTKIDQAWKDNFNQRKRKRDPKYESDGRSANTPRKSKLNKNDKVEKAMKTMKRFTKNFKSPEERSQKQEYIYAKPYNLKIKDKRRSSEFARRIRAKQMASDRLLHLSNSNIKKDNQNY
ncbi:uncharacterized protein FA14DRAFT_155886 [Meira miltonrushii]|uniref:Uncharacterized protein n=1 Tax=Meira miltonrushii TaxID=1280837 RepID=A0A316V6H2_9BASI|nr:uncharacterized protein FA14DRAFT_155886 [Meira miltonrushii]PWN33187.1 hypothetical protein FA14DRAFT_155886 [Meira miltonrushii]